MDVVARHKGKYGGRMRLPGDEFSLTDEAHFSTRWMVMAGTAEAKTVTALAAADKTLTPEQVAAEEAAATGKVSHRAELAAKNARIAELEAEVAALRGHLKAASATAASAGGFDAASAAQGSTEPEPVAGSTVAPERMSRRHRVA